MSEEKETSESGCEAEGDLNPVAVALALGGASREKADAFLDNQNALIADQRHHLHEQFKHLHLSVWEKQLGVLLRVATVVVGIGVAAAITFVIWEAAHSDGLVIEAFSVPPDLAQRGMTGQVVAAEFLDHLSQMQAETNSARAAKSYANNWSGQDIKLDIPEAGVSLVALDDFLREKLGHDTHITGEIVRTATGLSLIARAGRSGAESVTGSEADVTGLVAKSAEAIYRLTQPYRYAHLLADTGHVPDAIALDKELMKTGSKLDRMWAYATVGYLTVGIDGFDAGLRILNQAVAEEPNNVLGWRLIGTYSIYKSHPEEAVQAFQSALLHLSDNAQENYSPALIPAEQKILQASIGDQLGAFHDAAQVWADNARNPIPGDTAVRFSGLLAVSKIGEHDLAMARAADIGSGGPNFIWTKMLIDSEAQDWAGVVSQADALATLIQERPVLRSYYPVTNAPIIAYAEARLGKIADAEAHISATPADCYDCLITRARIAELQGQHPRADWWFARAVQQAPSIPFAHADWGQSLLARRKADDAIVQLKLANQKGPHFADPLEMWGQALIAKSQSHLALAKFTEADKYAPNWGRLHLKWGEALVYAGRGGEAQAQFARASQLDLTAADKAELARQSSHA